MEHSKITHVKSQVTQLAFVRPFARVGYRLLTQVQSHETALGKRLCQKL